MNALHKWKDRWNTMREQKNFGMFFIAVTLLSFGVYLFLSLISLGHLFPTVFYVRGTDFFMDFFNSIRDAAQGVEAYTERHIIYPPMANMFFWLLAKITPDGYNATEFDDRKDWMQEPVAIVLLLTFILICTLLFALCVWKSLRCDQKTKWLFTAASVLCIPYFNMMERGNILILCMIALLIYIQTYESEKWYWRELGLLALAFSFSIKLYPILFAWVLLADKRYWAIIRCALYSLAMLILPFFCFGGPTVFLSLLQNIFSFSSGGGGAASGITNFLHLPPQLLPILTYSIFGLAVLNFLVAPWVYEKRWKVLMCGCMAFVAFPSLTSTYGWILFLLPLILFVNEKEAQASDFSYIVTMTVPFAFLTIPITFHVTANAVAVYLALWILLGMTTVQTCKEIRARIREKKTA
ncbi:MAG: DUF2029 domain-containing protein [Clostridia bacterium]|nr:DUF2029 domain-containing protein [Clostridia bacterium]